MRYKIFLNLLSILVIFSFINAAIYSIKKSADFDAIDTTDSATANSIHSTDAVDSASAVNAIDTTDSDVNSVDSTDVVDLNSFYGKWEVTKLVWYSKDYFATDSVRKDLDSKINKPIDDDFFITIELDSYTESDPDRNYIINSPQYFYDTHTINNVNDFEVYNVMNHCNPYFESSKIAEEAIHYLVVRHPIKDKMDSEEVDWYYIPTPIFILIDENTILSTIDECVELYECKRVVN